MNHDERAALRQQIGNAMRPAVDQVISEVTRPYRRAIIWLGVGYFILSAASILQWVV